MGDGKKTPNRQKFALVWPKTFTFRCCATLKGGSMSIVSCWGGGFSSTHHSLRYTLHWTNNVLSILYTFHLTLCTLYTLVSISLATLVSSLSILISSLPALHYPLFTLCYSLSAHHSTLYTIHFTPHNIHSTMYTLYTVHSTLCTLCILHFTLHFPLLCLHSQFSSFLTLHYNTHQSPLLSLHFPLPTFRSFLSIIY